MSPAQPSTPSLDGNFVSDAAGAEPARLNPANHNSAPILKLLSECLPVTSAPETLGQLAKFWGQLLGCDWCLITAEGFCFPWEYAARWHHVNGITLTQPPSNFFDDDSSSMDENHHRIRLVNNDLGGESTVIESAAVPFLIDGTCIGWLDCSQPVPTTAKTAELFEVSSRILATAVTWQKEQTTSRLEAMAEFAAGAGHEVNNPLGTITGRVSQLLKSETDPQRRRSLELIGAQTYRIRDMISDTMTFARPPLGTPVDCNLSDAVNQVLALFANSISERNIAIVRRQSEPITVHIDETGLQIIISEGIKNAVNAVDDAGTIAIETTSKMLNGTHFAHLRITHHGTSPTQSELEHCLNPFYSGRQAGRGLGFGLSKSWRIAHAHGGELRFHLMPSGESTLDVLLPLQATSN